MIENYLKFLGHIFILLYDEPLLRNKDLKVGAIPEPMNPYILGANES